MTQSAVPFLRGAVKPIECYRLGWGAISGQYGVFLGVTFVGVLLASYGPLGILIGPMFCGLYNCYLRRLAGEEVTFGQLFRGFDHFVESLLATIPIFVASLGFAFLVVGVALAEVVGLLVFARGAGCSNGEPASGFVLAGLALVLFTVFALVVLLLLPLSILAAFAYPLIVDRRMPGFEALALGFRAGLANFWGLFGLFLLTFLLGWAGMCFCYVGVLLVLPLNFAAQAVAYRQVFPAEGPLPSADANPPASSP